MNKITKYQLRCSARILVALDPSRLNLPLLDNGAVNNILEFLHFNHELLDLENSIQTDILNYSLRIRNESNKVSKRDRFEYLQEISDRMECLESISSCMDMDLIAKRLVSSKVYISVFAIG